MKYEIKNPSIGRFEIWGDKELLAIITGPCAAIMAVRAIENEKFDYNGWTERLKYTYSR